MGKGRTTTGMILACLMKDVLHGDKSKKYYKDDTVNPKDFEDEDEVQEEVIANISASNNFFRNWSF